MLLFCRWGKTSASLSPEFRLDFYHLVKQLRPFEEPPRWSRRDQKARSILFRGTFGGGVQPLSPDCLTENPVSLMATYLDPDVKSQRQLTYHQKQSQISPKGQESESPRGPVQVISRRYVADTVSASSQTPLASSGEQSRTGTRHQAHRPLGSLQAPN